MIQMVLNRFIGTVAIHRWDPGIFLSGRAEILPPLTVSNHTLLVIRRLIVGRLREVGLNDDASPYLAAS